MPIEASFKRATFLSISSGRCKLSFPICLILNQVFHTQRLVGKTHVHHAGGCPSAAARLISRPSPAGIISCRSSAYIARRRADCLFLFGKTFQRRDIDFHVEMAAVGHDCASFIKAKCSLSMTFLSPVMVTKTSPILAASASHHIESVHGGFQRSYRLHFSHHDTGAHAFCPHAKTMSAPAVPQRTTILLPQADS